VSKEESKMVDGGSESRRRVVVTGAAGFVGVRVVEMLHASGRFDIVATDAVRSERSAVFAGLASVTFEVADLRDPEAMSRLVDGCDTVVHLAAVRTKDSLNDPRISYEVNVEATYDLLTLARRFGVGRFVYGSSHTVYGFFRNPDGGPYREDLGITVTGLNSYSAAKVASEAHLSAFRNSGGPESIALRFGTIYGPHVAPGSTGSLLLDVLTALDRGERPQIPWSRESLHALTYVDDVARAVVAATESTVTGLPINVVGTPVTSVELYSTLVRLYGGDPEVLDWRDEKARYQRVSQERMREVLGFVPDTPLETGLKTFIDWHRANSSEVTPR
jgi:nucleoside-diphosphate-sugar epimerase